MMDEPVTVETSLKQAHAISILYPYFEFSVQKQAVAKRKRTFP